MDIQDRPKLKLKMTLFECILNGVTSILFIGSMIYLISVWGTLPAEVPAHYNALGEVNRFGSKWEMVILPVTGMLLWIGITVLERYPHVYNYMNLTKENVRSQYLNARFMLNVLKNMTILIFVYLSWKDVQIAIGTHHSLGIWFLPVFLILLFVPMGYFVIRSLRMKK